MFRQMRRFAVLLLVLQLWTSAKAQEFPEMKDIFDEFYQAEVQLSDQNQDGTSLATEYYDKSQGAGRLDVLVYGNPLSIYYDDESGDILEVNATSCKVSEAEVSDYFYAEIFFGWLNKGPLVIGPSALLWFANKNPTKPEYIGMKEVSGIKCDHFQLNTSNSIEEISYNYYFAVEDWTTPYQLEGKRVPIRIAVMGQSSRESDKKDQLVPVNQVVEYSYFRPTIEDTKLQPDIGLGCYGRKGGIMMPKIPKEFRYATELYNLLKAENNEDTSATFMRVWFSTYTQLGRLDVYNQDNMASSIYDFKNGVIYSISNSMSCTINPLRNSIFEDDDKLEGYIKTPEKVLGLVGDFYYMGYRTIRGINCRVFESAVRDAFAFNNQYYLLVTTVFFTEPFTKGVVQGETVVNIPVNIQVTAYDEPNHVALKLQYNIFAFDDVVGPTMLSDFPLEDCFPLSTQKSYFIVNFNVDMDTARKLEGNNYLFLDSLKSELMKASSVSDIRIPFLKPEYTATGVYVTGLMLDRPPMLSQFWRFFYGPSKSFAVKKIDTAKTKELCAYSCVDEKDFKCRAFHFCEGTCYINQKSISEEMINADAQELGVCEVYIRADLNSTSNDPYLGKALDSLLSTQFSVKVILPEGTLEIPYSEIIVGEGPYRKNITEKSYNLVYAGYQLPPEADVTTALDKPEVTSETECFRTCKQETSMACQSFSYCPDAAQGSCRISSLYMVSDSADTLSILDNNKLCNVYSLLNLDFFDAYPGKVLKIQGEDSYTNITAEECAVRCKTEKKFTCRGFEYCSRSKSCLLHSKHVIDVKPGEIISTDMKCTHYAAKYSADYLDMGLVLVDDFSDTRKSLSLEQCARVCSEEVADCMSIIYCPSPNPYDVDSACSLTSKTMFSRNVKLTEKDQCHMYTKRDRVESYGSRRRRRPSGVSQSGFTGLVIGMLVFGLLVGVAAFVGFSYYRSRKYNDGMSVKFVNQSTN